MRVHKYVHQDLFAGERAPGLNFVWRLDFSYGLLGFCIGLRVVYLHCTIHGGFEDLQTGLFTIPSRENFQLRREKSSSL